MKLFLTALCASFMIIPTSFASECEKGKCDKEKKEEGTVLAVITAACDKCDCEKCKNGKCADCDKCKKAKPELMLAEEGKCKKKGGDCDKEKKDDGTLAADCDKCKKGEETKKEEGTLAHCGKCGKDKDHDKDKKEDDKKDEEKKEGTLAGKCKKDGDCDKEEKEEGTLA